MDGFFENDEPYTYYVEPQFDAEAIERRAMHFLRTAYCHKLTKYVCAACLGMHEWHEISGHLFYDCHEVFCSDLVVVSKNNRNDKRADMVVKVYKGSEFYCMHCHYKIKADEWSNHIWHCEGLKDNGERSDEINMSLIDLDDSDNQIWRDMQWAKQEGEKKVPRKYPYPNSKLGVNSKYQYDSEGDESFSSRE